MGFDGGGDGKDRMREDGIGGGNDGRVMGSGYIPDLGATNTHDFLGERDATSKVEYKKWAGRKSGPVGSALR